MRLVRDGGWGRVVSREHATCLRFETESVFRPNFYSICNVDFVQRLLHDMQLVPRAVNLLLLQLLLLLLCC